MIKSRYSGLSLADSTAQRANGFFFFFYPSKAKRLLLLTYLFYLLYFSYLFKLVGLKTPKASPLHWLRVHGPFFFQNWFFGVYVSGYGLFVFLSIPIKFILLGCINRVLVSLVVHKGTRTGN